MLFGLSLYAQGIIILEGKVTDQEDDPIPFVNIYIEGENLGTVTNEQGEFILKVPSHLKSSTLKISFIGYRTMQFPIGEIEDDLRVQLKEDDFMLKTVEITPYNALEIIRQAMAKMPDNHYKTALRQEGYYKGTTFFSDSIVQLEESAVNIYKTPMTSEMRDKAELIKRRFIQDKAAFAQLTKNLGGEFGFGASVNSFLAQDIVKQHDEYKLLSERSFRQHSFEVEEIRSLYETAVYVIAFEPKKRGWMQGELYIDTATLAFAGIQAAHTEQYLSRNKLFPLPVKFALKVLNIFPVIHRSNVSVSYEPIDGQWYMKTGEINIDLSLYRKKSENNIRFNVAYTISSHHETTLDQINGVQTEADKDYFKSRADDGDDAFWKNYNVIKQSNQFQDEFERLRKKNIIFEQEKEANQSK